MNDQEKQRLVNEWHRFALERDRLTDAGRFIMAGKFEEQMARIETQLATIDVNPGNEQPEAQSQLEPIERTVEAPEIAPEFAQTLSEQDRKNLEHFWGRKG